MLAVAACPRRIAVDLQHPLFLTYSPNLVRATLRGAAAVARMADDLRVMAASVAAITADDMELLGWTRAQLALHGPDARAAAMRAAERKLS